MKRLLAIISLVCVVVVLAVAPDGAEAQITKDEAAKSPWGPDDEIGAHNMMTEIPQMARPGFRGRHLSYRRPRSRSCAASPPS